MAHGVVAVNATIELGALSVWSSGLGDSRPVGTTMGSVQPSVRPPREAVREIVTICMVTEAIEEYLRLAIRYVVTIAIRNEIEGRR